PAYPGRGEPIAGVIREGHCGLLPDARLPTMVDAWHARNVTMARRLAAALDRGLRVVVIVGRGHQAAGGARAALAPAPTGARGWGSPAAPATRGGAVFPRSSPPFVPAPASSSST